MWLPGSWHYHRDLALHDDLPGLAEGDWPCRCDLDCYGGLYRLPGQTVLSSLAGAAQLQPDDISSCCYIGSNCTDYTSRLKSHMANRGRLSILTKLPGESFPSSAGSDQLFYPLRRHGSTLEYQTMPSLREITHDGWLCTFIFNSSWKFHQLAAVQLMSGQLVRCGKKQVVWPVHRVQNHTCRVALLQPARRAAELSQLSILRPHWFLPAVAVQGQHTMPPRMRGSCNATTKVLLVTRSYCKN